MPTTTTMTTMTTTTTTTTMAGARRSKRFASTHYDSNGRDYLASLLDLSVRELENFLGSASVHRHLRRWHDVCVVAPAHFNEGIAWINAGAAGYFYSKDGLEEDMGLMCLGEGNGGGGRFGDDDDAGRTGDGATAELWARTAWRIVQSNRGAGQVFEHDAVVHPARAYGFAIDLLCIAFHSIAYRNSASVWSRILTGRGEGVASSTTPCGDDDGREMLAREEDRGEEDMTGSHAGSYTTSSGDGANSRPRTPETQLDEGDAPRAPKKSVERTRARG
jgi:hypothetical protein